MITGKIFKSDKFVSVILKMALNCTEIKDSESGEKAKRIHGLGKDSIIQ